MNSPSLRIFVGVVLAGALLRIFIPLPPLPFFLGLFGLALVAAIVFGRAGASTSGESVFKAGKSRYLCDSCKYDDARYCNRSERPNATECPDYKAR